VVPDYQQVSPMTLSQAILAEGTQITLPPSKSVVIVMIFLAMFAFVRGKTFVATAIFLIALVIAGAASLYNQLPGTTRQQQEVTSAVPSDPQPHVLITREPREPAGDARVTGMPAENPAALQNERRPPS
jgi:hypothetical protein